MRSGVAQIHIAVAQLLPLFDGKDRRDAHVGADVGEYAVWRARMVEQGGARVAADADGIVPVLVEDAASAQERGSVLGLWVSARCSVCAMRDFEEGREGHGEECTCT